MQNIKINNVDILNPLENKEQKIIDCFAWFFGEEYRAQIEKSLKSALCLFIPKSTNKYETFLKTLNSLQKKEGDKFIESFYNEIGYNHKKVTNRVFNPEFALILKNKIETNSSLTANDYKSLFEILLCKFNIPFNKNAKEVVDGCLMSSKDKKKLIELLTEINTKWKSSTQRKSFNESNENINTLIESVQNANRFAEEENNKAENEIRKVIIEKIKQVKNVSEEELLKEPNIEAYISQMGKIALGAKNKFLSDEWLSSEDFKDIKLYNFLGFNYGFDYASYLDDDKLINEVLSNEFIAKIHAIWAKRTQNIFENDMFLNEAFNRANNIKYYCHKGLVIKDIYDFSTIDNDDCACTLQVFGENKELLNVCLFSSPLTTGDDTFIHELCHAISSFGKISKDLKTKIRCGLSELEFTTQDSNNFTFANLLNDYELEDAYSQWQMLNEVVTDYFSYKILNIFKENNVKVCLGKNEKSCYARMFGMMQDLIEENLDIFKNAYIQGNNTELYKLMPVADINELSDILDDVMECFSGSNFKKFEQEIKEKTEITDNILYNVKPYINKDLGWTDEIKKLFKYYNKIDKIAEEIKNRKKIMKNNDKIQ